MAGPLYSTYHDASEYFDRYFRRNVRGMAMRAASASGARSWIDRTPDAGRSVTQHVFSGEHRWNGDKAIPWLRRWLGK